VAAPAGEAPRLSLAERAESPTIETFGIVLIGGTVSVDGTVSIDTGRSAVIRIDPAPLSPPAAAEASA
jgi:hypothetical protein